MLAAWSGRGASVQQLWRTAGHPSPARSLSDPVGGRGFGEEREVAIVVAKPPTLLSVAT